MSSSQKDALQKKLKGLSISTKPPPPPTVPVSISSPTRTKPLLKPTVSSPKTPITPVFQQARRRLSVVSGAADQSRAQIDGYMPEAKRSMSVIAATSLAEVAAAKDQMRRGSVPADKPRGPSSPVSAVNQTIAPAAAAFSAFASLSKVGFVPFNNGKINQDRAMINIKFDNSDSKALFGVYDGHGVKGHEVSQFCSRELPKHLLAQAVLNLRPTEALTKAFHETTDSLRNSAIDCNFSGTTAIVCYLVGKKIYACNTGDSRAVLAQEQPDSKGFNAVALSIDHKPDRPEEARRIIDHKGRVHCCKGPDGMPLGPVRVWLGKQDVPGLAMTRSIGDLVASTVGVISTPEIIEREIGPSDRFMILATDGVWEFITNQEAVNIVGQCATAEEACQALVIEATNRWKSQEEVIDDITCIVVFFGKK